MRNRRFLFEAPPVSDYLPDEFKSQARTSATSQDRNEKMRKLMSMQQAMSSLPNLEKEHKTELEELAVQTLLDKYPLLKRMVDNDKIIIDAKITSSPGGRQTPQNISPREISTQKEKHPQFSSLEKKRHFQNAQTQGRAWVDGFNSIMFVEDELNDIDPNLYDKYRDFTKGVSEYYWENADMLERMASTGMGRLAYTDVQETPDGKVKIEARAPFFPLLVHELIKGAEYYKSLFSLPKDQDLRKAILKTADTHKHEIKNMNFGRELVNRLRSIFSSVDGYRPNMEVIISTQMDNLPEDEYNEYMDSVVNNDQSGVEKLKKFVKTIVDRLK